MILVFLVRNICKYHCATFIKMAAATTTATMLTASSHGIIACYLPAHSHTHTQSMTLKHAAAVLESERRRATRVERRQQLLLSFGALCCGFELTASASHWHSQRERRTDNTDTNATKSQFEKIYISF